MAVHLDFFTDPAAFLEAARTTLAASPVQSTVVATVADRLARDAADGRPPPPDDWYVIVREAGRVTGVGMRTAPFEPRPLFLLPMSDEAAAALAQALHERGEEVRGANGALPAARVFAEETARLTGRTARVNIHTRLFELDELIPPRRSVPGRLRRATADDLDLVRTWFAAFLADADEQAGRPAGSLGDGVPEDEATLRRIDAGYVWLWEDADGRRVHLTAANPPSLGVARIGPVYTPRDERGRGWASAGVAAVSQHLLDLGARPCLFTDQANPTSNGIYIALGYRPVVDMAFMVVE
jgi:predicted GNAT family acetyltransferase